MDNSTINNIINTLTTTMGELKTELNNNQELKTLQTERRNAQDVIADLTKKITELTAIQSYNAAAIGPEIQSLTTLKTTAEGKLAMIDAATADASAAHQTAYDEYTKVKAGIETLTSLTYGNYQQEVDDILDLTPIEE